METPSLTRFIYPVIEEFRSTLENPNGFKKDPATELFGTNGVLDSLTLVSFIVAVEERIELEAGVSVRLVSEKAMSRKNSPFRTLSSLAAYVDELLATNEQ